MGALKTFPNDHWEGRRERGQSRHPAYCAGGKFIICEIATLAHTHGLTHVGSLLNGQSVGPTYLFLPGAGSAALNYVNLKRDDPASDPARPVYKVRFKASFILPSLPRWLPAEGRGEPVVWLHVAKLLALHNRMPQHVARLDDLRAGVTPGVGVPSDMPHLAIAKTICLHI